MTASDDPSLRAVALAKLTRVLGVDRSEQELALALAELELSAIATVDDLDRVAQVLQRRPGFVATVGAMLAVDVAMRRLRAS